MTGWQLVNLTPNLVTAKSITGQMLPTTLTMVVMMSDISSRQVPKKLS